MQMREVKNVNIKHLSYVVEICRCGSINKAARTCIFPSPASAAR